APTPTAVDDVAQAMSLLDEAEELIEQSQDPDLDRRAELTNYRTRGLDWLGRDLVSSYLNELKSSQTPALGYYCEALLVARHAASAEGLDRAIDILEGAKATTALGERSLRLLISLIRRHPAHQFEFERLLTVYEQLEQAVGARMQPVERFRQAVLY